MSFLRKEVQGRYRIEAPLPDIHQVIYNYYASQNIQLFLQPPPAPHMLSMSCTTSLSFWSWGEEMTFLLYPAEQNATYVDVSSKPSLWGAIDFGVNKKNIEKLAHALTTYFNVQLIHIGTV